jgi:hypothetical protein
MTLDQVLQEAREQAGAARSQDPAVEHLRRALLNLLLVVKEDQKRIERLEAKLAPAPRGDRA